MVLLLKCNEGTFIDELSNERITLNKTLNASAFMNGPNKRTKSSDLIKINDSVNNLNLSLSIHQIRPVTYQEENKQKGANGKGTGINNPIKSIANGLVPIESVVKNSQNKNKTNEKSTSYVKVIKFCVFYLKKKFSPFFSPIEAE